MDEEQVQADVEPQSYNPVVTVPTLDGPLTAPADVASQWDERIWVGRSCW